MYFPDDPEFVFAGGFFVGVFFVALVHYLQFEYEYMKRQKKEEPTTEDSEV